MFILYSDLPSCRCPGKLLWLSGAPGMGKSTSAQLLARNHGYVYYEADAFAMMLNPFVDLHDDNPSMATAKQRILKGEKQLLCIQYYIPSLYPLFNV